MSQIARVAYSAAFKTAAVTLVSVLLVLVYVGLKPIKTQALSSGTITTLTNSQRAAAGLAPLNSNSKLNGSASAKAQDMLNKGYWAHTSPEGTTAWTFISSAGYVFSVAGENLAKGFVEDEAVIAGWMASPTHKANILNPNFRELGIGLASGTQNGEAVTIVVAHYASPLSSPAPASAKTAEPPEEDKVQVVLIPADAAGASVQQSQQEIAPEQTLLSQVKALVSIIGQLLTIFALGGDLNSNKVIV